MNKVILIGRLVADPETRQTQAGGLVSGSAEKTASARPILSAAWRSARALSLQTSSCTRELKSLWKAV